MMNQTKSSPAFDETSFALSIKHALNDSANSLPQDTLDKLYAARRRAVQAKHSAQHNASIAQVAQRWIQSTFAALGAPLAFAAPALIVGVGLYVMAINNADNYVQTVAEIDSQVLTQDLPIDALLDKGFVRYVQVGE